MNLADKIAAGGVGVCVGSVDLAEKLKAIDALLHTGTLIVGFVAGAASIVYYWTNRRVTRTTKVTTTETTTASPKREPEAGGETG